MSVSLQLLLEFIITFEKVISIVRAYAVIYIYCDRESALLLC